MQKNCEVGMADVDPMDDLGKQEVLMRMKLNITRMRAQIEENEFKLFMIEKDKRRLTDSIDDAKKAIQESEAELKKHQAEWGM